jgi:hypothetical protein
VDRARDPLLAGPRLPEDQDRRIGARHALGVRQHPAQRGVWSTISSNPWSASISSRNDSASLVSRRMHSSASRRSSIFRRIQE